MSDLVFNTDQNGKTTHMTLWLRSAKFQEKVGAMVTIPALGKVPHCPVRAMRRYLKYRDGRVDRTRVLPLYMTENLWVAGSVKPNKTSPGFYTMGQARPVTK